MAILTVSIRASWRVWTWNGIVNPVLSERQGKLIYSRCAHKAPAVFSMPLGLFVQDVMTVQRQTIVHNVSDEPIIVEQTDGSHITVPARGKRPAELPSEVDFLIPEPPRGPVAPP
jgi:hypothetical protein